MRLITSSRRSQLFAGFAAVQVVFAIGVVVATVHLSGVSSTPEQTSASTQQIVSSAQGLSLTAEELQKLVSQFTFS
jgi:hypothetical protein